MQKFSIKRPKKYMSGSEEKTLWLDVGVITKFDNGNMIMELNHSPETFQIFPFQDKKPQQPEINVPQNPF